MQLIPPFFPLYKSPYFSDYHGEQIIVVAILVNFLRIFKVRKVSPFHGHDRAVAKNGASWRMSWLPRRMYANMRQCDSKSLQNVRKICFWRDSQYRMLRREQ